jgi:hypothetical protein
MKPELTQDRLKELLHYDPETGHFTWLAAPKFGSVKAGSMAGSTGKNGYTYVGVGGAKYLAHRLAFLFMTGSTPDEDVDHVNRDRSDNRWINLRPATRSENMANTGPPGNNTSGHRGVHLRKDTGRWSAYGQCGPRRVYLGCFGSREEASEVVSKWRVENYGEFAAA